MRTSANTGGDAPPARDEMPDVLHLYYTGALDEAEARCRAIVERDPGHGAAWDRLARIAERRGHLAAAEEHFQRAIATLADPAEAHNNLAVLLQRRGALDGALTHYRRAIALGLRHALLHSNLGCVLRSLGQLQESADELARALAIDDALAHAHSNLGVTLALQGEIAAALAHARRAVALQPAFQLAHSNLLFCLNYADDLGAEEIAAQHRAFGRKHPPPDELAPGFELGDGEDPDRRLRVGLVSPDFKQHSVAYFIEPLLEGCDRERDALELTGYSDAPCPDAITQRLRAAADRWRPIQGFDDAAVAQRVRADRIDILIDLAGHTAGNRMSLFAARVAPVQMTYLGYPNTTGLDSVDWRITDAWADPPGTTEALHSEELLRITGGFLCFRPRPDSPEPAPLPLSTSAGGRVTFGSFNLPAKISPATMRMWAEILRRTPRARLLLKGASFGDPATRAAYQRRLAQSPLAGLDVELCGPLPDERGHLAAYGRVDIALDTFPYGGTTTTCEALWMGVPVVTLAGRAHASRVGASLLARLGEPSLIADSPAAYVDAAVTLAAAPERLQALRATLRERMRRSGITDGAEFARHFAQALRRAWRIHCERARAARAPLPAGTTSASMRGPLRVVVPDTLDQITPYVLAEQHDWFEDEIDFVRAALVRGDRAVDIGANHGVYTLAAAQRVGLTGRVWAFEPGGTVAERLRASLTVNGLPQAEVVAAAVSDREGSGTLVGGAHSELGHLQRPDDAGTAAGPGEAVALVTLDACRARLGLRDIAFIKIDAEGAEAAIIDGGRHFFAEESPLVMFEVRPDAAAIDTDLVARFQRLGYRAYRLVPGLGLLAPIDGVRTLDPFTLNLFACRADRAQLLERRGLLALAAPDPTGAGSNGDASSSAWLNHLRAQLFTAPLWPRWSSWIAALEAAPSLDRAYASALDHFAVARQITEPPARRVAALTRALDVIRACAREQPTLAILQSFARIAADAGERVQAAQALSQIVERCTQAGATLTAGDGPAHADAHGELGCPFLAVSARFDDIAPIVHDDPRELRQELLRWVTAAALEQRERLRAFSSFYTAREPATLTCLETIARLGYQSPEMARRLELVKRRLGR
jgi:FkbM family methyltransferase